MVVWITFLRSHSADQFYDDKKVKNPMVDPAVKTGISRINKLE
jgi:hypothetical protein